MSFFDNLARSFVDVDISKGIDTQQFLEAAEGLVELFDKLGAKAFSVVKNDMLNNIKKIRERLLANPAANDTLQNLMAAEAPEKKRNATEGLLWLTRGLDFTAKALRRSLNERTEELNVSFTKAYETSLKPHHNFALRPVFSLVMKSCPYRKDFYETIGVINEAGHDKMEKWLEALEKIIEIIQGVFKANPAYIKGM